MGGYSSSQKPLLHAGTVPNRPSMPKRRPPHSVEADTLEALRRHGVISDVLDARLAHTELEGIRRYVADLAERDRIYPLMLPTAQASGRWSTTSPPLTNFPRHDLSVCQLPDPTGSRSTGKPSKPDSPPPTAKTRKTWTPSPPGPTSTR